MTAWVFHRGALGDSALLWPMLRALRRAGGVTLVTGGEIGRLAARRVGVEALDAEQARFVRLWVAGAGVEPAPEVRRVVWFGARDGAGVWLANAGSMFPGARISVIERRPDRRFALRWSPRAPAVAPAGDPDGPVTLHVGAGSASKRWPLARWLDLASRLRARGEPATLLAGEVDMEQFSAAERAVFEGAGGRFALELEALAEALASSQLVVCADSGPGHLAAQMGVPTVSLFGPTDPERWAPVGPSVRVIAPAAPAPMSWLAVEAVMSGLSWAQIGYLRQGACQ